MALRREAQVEDRILEVFKKFVNQKFNGVTIVNVVRQYSVGDRRGADIAVLKDDGNPILIIETKKKYERGGGFRIERRFVPTSEEVVGQAVAYAAILKRNNIYVPFVATATETQLALFFVPENVEDLVNWDAVERREYGRVVKRFYEFRKDNLILHRPHRFSEEFSKELLDIITGIYVKKFGLKEKRQELHWALIEDLRSFVDVLAPFVQEAIAQDGRFRSDIAGKLEKYARTRGYSPTPEGLAREMAYVLLNKIAFYKVLESIYNNIPKLEPLYEKGFARTCSEYLRRLNELFEKAVEVSRDFEAIFQTGIYDAIEVVESEEVLITLDWLVRLLDHYKVEKLGDVIGFIYEELIPAEERHRLGQFYTPRPIAELIVRWSVRSPDDKVLDPGCGSGTFLVEAYKRLAELKLRRPFEETRHVSKDVHRQILGQLYGIDINEFPAHLTAVNLAMKNVRTSSDAMNIFVKDYFTIKPGQKVLAPYRVKTPEGEKPAEAVFKDFDAVVGNPPYTRWTEIPEATRKLILTLYTDVMRRYGLEPAVVRGVEPGIYVYWIMHSTGFLREGGRLGMIISNMWLQTDYGVGFFRYLLDHYKVHAVIDISTRVFPVPLISTCIVLLEKSGKKEDRDENNVVFAYLDPGREVDVGKVLELVEKARSSGHAFAGEIAPGVRALVKVYRQGDLVKYEDKVINLLFGTDEIIEILRRNPLMVGLSAYFEPSYGNILYLYLTSTGRIRGVRNVGGNEFFYLSEERAEQLGIPREFLHPLIPSPRYSRFFTFTREDWDAIRREGGKCYLFLCHRPRGNLPEPVRRYVELGEGPNAQIRLRRRPGEREGRPVSESLAAEARRGHRDLFFDWYDLGGVVDSPIIAPRYTQYWHRFALLKFEVACDDDVMALIPLQNVLLEERRLKALLAYLNSSFAKLYIETRGRSTGGGSLALEANVLSEMPVLDINRLSEDLIEKLASLFDKLESEARGLGSADEVENVFGSELARELTGKSSIKSSVGGLFNTAIKDIDHEIARMLGLENMVEFVRSMVLEMAKRRLARAGEAKREAIRGSEPLRELRGEKGRSEGGGGPTKRLDEWIRRR